MLVGPDGAVEAVYRKIHMFDVDVGGVSYRESAATAAGDEVVVARALGRTVGMSVCYDLRFPELYRRLADGGAEIIVVPAAFTSVTGRDHWEPLLRARAIENQAFVIAAGQHGRHDDGTESHGRSMVVDPWGIVLAQAPDGEGLAVADLDFARLEDVRARLPALRHRRPDVYGGPRARGGSGGSRARGAAHTCRAVSADAFTVSGLPAIVWHWPGQTAATAPCARASAAATATRPQASGPARHRRRGAAARRDLVASDS